MMQRKHYNAIAAALYSGKSKSEAVTEIAKIFAKHNINFDFDKFFDKAFNGPSMEQRAEKYRAQIKRAEKWKAEGQ